MLGPEHIDLIFDFSSWVLHAHAEEGLKIFTEDLPEVEELPRAKVYDFLFKSHRRLALPYLEHVVFEWQDTNALFHNALAVLYKDKVLRLTKQLEEDEKKDSKDPILQSELQSARGKFRSFLEISQHVAPDIILVQFPYNCKRPLLFHSQRGRG